MNLLVSCILAIVCIYTQSPQPGFGPNRNTHPPIFVKNNPVSKEIVNKEFQTTKTSDSVVDANALTIVGGYGHSINGKSFQQDAIVSLGGYQYIAYYDADRHVCIARRKLPEGTWENIRFLDYDFKSNDAHNTISLGICPQDGTIHLAFDHHCDPLNYRVSQTGVALNPETVEWKASLFGTLKSKLVAEYPVTVTYPRFFQTPDGGLQFCYRRDSSGQGDRMLMDYQPKKGGWANVRQIDSREGSYRNWKGKMSQSRCSYPNGYHYGPTGKLHATWVWREKSGGDNHDLLYAYSEDQGNTWRNNAGDLLESPMHIRSPGIIVAAINGGLGLLNTQGQAVDSKGRIHFTAKYCTPKTLLAANSTPGEFRWGPPEARRYFHYWRDENSVWHHVQLPGIAGSRPKLFLDDNDNAFLVFSDLETSRDVDRERGNLKIMAATAETQWNDWSLVHVEKGPFGNEMLGDLNRWKKENVLSIMVQELRENPHAPSCIRVLDFVFSKK